MVVSLFKSDLKSVERDNSATLIDNPSVAHLPDDEPTTSKATDEDGSEQPTQTSIPSGSGNIRVRSLTPHSRTHPQTQTWAQTYSSDSSSDSSSDTNAATDTPIDPPTNFQHPPQASITPTPAALVPTTSLPTSTELSNRLIALKASLNEAQASLVPGADLHTLLGSTSEGAETLKGMEKQLRRFEGMCEELSQAMGEEEGKGRTGVRIGS